MRKIIAIVLTFLLLIGNTGVTVGMHYCHGQVVESIIAYGVQDISCVRTPKAGSCELPTAVSKSRSCCQDEYHVLNTDHSQLSQYHISLSPPAILFSVSPLVLAPITDRHDITFFEYPPPLPPTNRPALLQVFII